LEDHEAKEKVLNGAEGVGNVLSMLTWFTFGAVVFGASLQQFDWQVLVYAVLSLTVVRMVPVLLCLIGVSLRTDSKLFLGWFGGVSPGAADRPIFWYRPKDSKKYRVIYADLSVGDADTAPNVPLVPPQQDLIDALHYYSELCDDTFPDSLDKKGFFQVLEKKFGAYVGQRATAKQADEAAEIELKLQPGVAFANSLPAEADAHYAGKGVVRGKADTPIFWYRPKDAKKYRVIYADLSVREADTPPNVSKAQPVPAASGPKE